MSGTPSADTATGAIATIESDGFTVTSNSETAEQLTENLKPEPAPAEDEPDKAHPDPKLSKAAAELGKKGGEATAEKRAAEAKAAQEAEAAGEAEAAETAKDGEAEKLGKPRHDPKARMLEATRKEAEAKREAARLAARVAELEAKTAPAKEAAKPVTDAAKPKAEDFATYEEFVEAISDWKADQRLKTYQKETEERAQSEARHQGINRAVHTFQGRVAEAMKADPTYKERTADIVKDLQPSFTLSREETIGPLNVMADEVINSEQAPALMLHFAEHPDDFQRIQALRTPSEIQREMAKLEGRLERLDAATTAISAKPEVSQARPPVRPVTGSPHTADVAPGDEASFDEHVRYHNAKDRARR